MERPHLYGIVSGIAFIVLGTFLIHAVPMWIEVEMISGAKDTWVNPEFLSPFWIGTMLRWIGGTIVVIALSGELAARYRVQRLPKKDLFSKLPFDEWVAWIEHNEACVHCTSVLRYDWTKGTWRCGCGQWEPRAPPIAKT